MTTFATLKTDITELLVRSDFSASDLARFVRLGEARIRRRIRCRAQETTTALAVSTLETALPADFLEARAVTLDSTNGRALKPLTPDQLRSSVYVGEAGEPRFYAIEGSNLLVAPIQSCTVNVSYYGAFDALSADSDTNWLLTNAYDVYLYACARGAAEFIEDDNLEDRFEAKFEKAAAEVNDSDRRAYWGGGTTQTSRVDGTVV